MQRNASELSYEIELQPGEKLSLPPALVDQIGPGHWLVSVSAIPAAAAEHVRGHTAFLNGYVAEDEGLYDDYPAG